LAAASIATSALFSRFLQQNTVNQYDGVRLFIFNMLQLAPFLFTMLGVHAICSF
jgi:hypothetical protein